MKIRDKLVPTLSVVLMSVFPVMFLYFKNAGEAHFSGCLKPAAVYLAAGLVIFALAICVTRSSYVGAVYAMPFILLFQNYSFLERAVNSFFPVLKYWHILPIAIVLLLHICWLINRRLPRNVAKDIVLVLSLVFLGLILLNGAMAAPAIIRTGASRERDEAFSEQTEKTDSDDSNIYWLLFDEYSNFDIIKKYYHYDNDGFARFLEQRGFHVSYDGINDSQQTNTIVANYVSLEYVADDSMTISERVSIRHHNNEIFSTMRANGYQIEELGEDTVQFFPTDAKPVKAVSTSMEGDDFYTILIKSSALCITIPETQSGKIEEIKGVMDAFQAKEFYQENGRFVVLYEDLPHQPFVFRQDGSQNPILKWHDWVDPEVYLGQYIYTTSLLEILIDNIIENDPNAIIVLQSDHSARSLQDEEGHYLIDKFDRRHFLNAVYYKGEDVSEIDGQSGVNTWRLILSRRFGVELPVLEVPVSEYEF